MNDENEQDQWPPVWAFRLFGGIHVLRALGLFAILVMQIIMRALYLGGLDPLFIGVSPIIILDLLFGFLLLMRKKVVYLPVMIYIMVLGFPTLLMFLVLHPPYISLPSLLGYSFIIEIFLMVFLGLMWIKREWVHNDQDQHIPQTDK